MKTLGYYNGTIGELDEMQIPMLDRACYFGDGVYDATIARNHKIVDLDMHIARFFNSARLLEMKPAVTEQQLRDLLISLCRQVDAKHQFVYWQLSRGVALRGHAFPQEGESRLWIMINPLGEVDFSRKFRLITVEDTRFLHCNIKTLNLIPSVMASEKAKQAGCDEAVFHRGDRVTECAHSNVHILQNGTLRTAPTDNLILPGITRINLLDTCRQLSIPVDETPFTLDELMQADEVIVTSSGVMCVAAVSVDGVPVGGKDPQLFERIQQSIKEQYFEQTKE